MPATPRPHLLAATIGLLAIALVGCAEGDVTAEPTPTATFVSTLEMNAPAVSGTGPTDPFPGVDFPLHEGARSVTIAFACEGGTPFHIELGDAMALGQSALGGTCDGTTELVWPITEKTAPTLYVWTAEGVEWVATPRFSTAEFVPDAAITTECAAFAKVYSALINADLGYTTYQAFDLAEWTSRIDTASAGLAALTDASQTTMADGFAQVLAQVRDADLAPGFLESGVATIDALSDTCNTNHTPFILTAEFGG